MADVFIPVHALKGRGAATRLPHRFERDVRDAFDDGWGTLEEGAAEPLPPLATEVRFEDVKSVLSENDSPDIYFDRSINPYRGCEHGCIYCFARPTHSYLNLSPGLDFETKLIAKRNIAEVLRAELGRRSYRPEPHRDRHRHRLLPADRARAAPHALGDRAAEGNAPSVRRWSPSRARVERDLDLIAPMAAERLAAVYVTITTLDGELARKLEPRAAAPHRRLRTVRTLAEAGVPVRRERGAADSLRHRRHGAGARSRVGSRRAQRLLHGDPRCPGRWRRCSSNGWSCTTRSARAASWRASARCAAARTTTPTSPRA